MFSGRSETIKTRQMIVQVNVSDKISMNATLALTLNKCYFRNVVRTLAGATLTELNKLDQSDSDVVQ